MSRDASISLDWADGTYPFALKWGQLKLLQEACDAGPQVILQRLKLGAWRVEDISSVVRLGLIGGGLDPARALKLTQDYVEARPPLENRALAIGILSAGLIGALDEPPGKARRHRKAATV